MAVSATIQIERLGAATGMVADALPRARAFSVPIESERRALLFVLTRFLDANRYPLRSKTL
jgi:hypothetical protein